MSRKYIYVLGTQTVKRNKAHPLASILFCATLLINIQCVNYARIWVFYDPYFPVKGQTCYIRKNAGQGKLMFWDVLCSDLHHKQKTSLKGSLKLKSYSSMSRSIIKNCAITKFSLGFLLRSVTYYNEKDCFNAAQKMKFFIEDFFSKCDRIRRKPQIWSHLLKKSLMENLIFCAALMNKPLVSNLYRRLSEHSAEIKYLILSFKIEAKFWTFICHVLRARFLNDSLTVDT